MNTCSRLILLACSLLFASGSVLGQKKNARLFIEPNVSLSYDSTLFRITSRYANTFHETEAYDVTYLENTANRITIHIQAERPLAGSPSGSWTAWCSGAWRRSTERKMIPFRSWKGTQRPGISMGFPSPALLD